MLECRRGDGLDGINLISHRSGVFLCGPRVLWHQEQLTQRQCKQTVSYTKLLSNYKFATRRFSSTRCLEQLLCIFSLFLRPTPLRSACICASAGCATRKHKTSNQPKSKVCFSSCRRWDLHQILSVVIVEAVNMLRLKGGL